ncbi:MAG TPA: SRPBCC family protein [Candidatus Limnocylindria bacterium]|jgi:carbon monoxide dehydrogenase subunit G|nr:SRPBCC family protein [Candidatus Limnocylindria bacterium]
MKFTHAATVAAPRDKVWARLMDIPAAARCVPGVASVRPSGTDKYQGTLAVQVGPVRLVLDGDLVVTARDPSSGTASIRADAKDSRVGGAIRAAMDLALSEKEGQTELRIATDLAVMGRLGEFGQAVIKRKADQLMQDFAECLARQVIAR